MFLIRTPSYYGLACRCTPLEKQMQDTSEQAGRNVS
jgi:hypothetical protein